MPGWHDYVRPYLDHNWLQVPWFFAETYFYRRLIAITDFFRTGFDPFATQKQQGLHTTVARGQALATQTHRSSQMGGAPRASFHLLTLALWGNQADMSLWAPDDPTQPHHRPADHPHEHLVVNEAEAVAHFLTALQGRAAGHASMCDCLLDNAGFELLGDLCLADYLLSTAQVQTVRVHAKVHPTFVSDAIMVDVHATIAWLRHHADSALRTLGNGCMPTCGTGVYKSIPIPSGPRPCRCGRCQTTCESSWRRPMWCWRKAMPIIGARSATRIGR
jgi:hypothetical protein